MSLFQFPSPLKMLCCIFNGFKSIDNIREQSNRKLIWTHFFFRCRKKSCVPYETFLRHVTMNNHPFIIFFFNFCWKFKKLSIVTRVREELCDSPHSFTQPSLNLKLEKCQNLSRTALVPPPPWQPSLTIPRICTSWPGKQKPGNSRKWPQQGKRNNFPVCPHWDLVGTKSRQWPSSL